MNIRLLIVAIILLLGSCTISNETVSYQYKNYAINEISDSIHDENFMKILQPYKSSLEEVMSEVIAVSEMDMTSYRPESPLSNFVSDIVLDYSVTLSQKKVLGAVPQFALINHGSIRTSLPKGDITMRNAFELMPFENELVFVKLTGQQVRELANYIVIREGEGVAGISFGMKNNMAVDIKVQELMIDNAKSYWMATSDYIANGGDGMKVLTWAEERIDTGHKMRDIMIEQMKELHKSGKKLHAKSDGRLYHAK